MSLNKYEQGLFDYLDGHPDERRYWQMKVADLTRRPGGTDGLARDLERDLWDYFRERSENVPRLRDLNEGGLRRISFLNLSEYLLRIFGPPAPPRPKVSGLGGDAARSSS